MADDVTLNAMTGGDVIGADDISSVKYQRVKIIVGANGTNDGDVCAGAPLPVTAAVTAVVPGVAATSLGKAIDTALGATDTGVLALAVRDDTLNVRSGTENDVEPLHTDASGALWVDPRGNVAHDDGDSGNPIKVGGRAVLTTSTQTMVAANEDRKSVV